MRTPSPPWCRLDRSHLWPTGSSLGRPPLITARDFSSCLSDSTSRWTPCPPESASGGFRFTLAVSSFRLRARLGFSIPSPSPANEAINPRFRIRHSSFECRRDFNPPERRAAQHTPWFYRRLVAYRYFWFSEGA